MNDLNRALGDISSIRRQMASTTQFRGYGPVTLASTGLLAIAAAGVQTGWLPEPASHLPMYAALWSATAALSAGLIGLQMYQRAHRIHSGMADEMIRMAVAQFLPSVGVGAALTLVLLRYVPTTAWMLPGMWQIVFSLGVFSSCRFLPKPMAAAAVWYLVTGLACIAVGDARAVAPWTMGLAYGAGQMLVAGILLLAKREDGDEG